MSKRISPYLDSIMNPGGVQFPVKRGTWDFIEQSREESLARLAISLIGSSFDLNKVYILYGCEKSSSSGTTTISIGFIFYYGEIYQHNGSSFPDPVGPNVVIANLKEVSWQPTDANGDTYADPVNFIGSSPANVHIDRTVTFLGGASGSGTITNNVQSNYSNIIGIYPIVENRAGTDIDGDTITFERSRYIQYTVMSTTPTIIIDATNARIGSEIVIVKSGPSITTGTVFSFSGTASIVFNTGANVAGVGRKKFKLKCVGIDTLNVLGSGAGDVLIEMINLNDA